MTTSTTPPAHLARVYELLIATYGKPEWVADYDPLGGLVGTILSQHTSDSNSERAYQQLMATFPTWEKVRDAPTNEVANAIRSGGLANIKAHRIQQALETLHKQLGDTVIGSFGTPADAPFYVAPTRLRIVGTATLPAVVGSGSFADHTTMGSGAILSNAFLIS